jgi:hypothetical protein
MSTCTAQNELFRPDSLESNSQIQRVTPATIQGYGAEIVDDFGNVVPRPPRKYRRALAPRTGESLEATSLKDKVVVRQFEQSRARLAQEIASLQRRGNLNLVLGILISFLGLSVLGYYLLIDKAQTNGVPPPAEDPIAFLIHYIPRLTFVLLIELFAYFFLKLYKNSLSEIKYFQNEPTNIEAKHIALRAAFLADSETLSDKAISSLVDTERNHVLEKGQTTVNLERARIDREQWTDIAKTFSSILDFVKKGGKTK